MAKFTIKASDICGTHVENWEGENLGTITDIMIDKHDGDIQYLVLSYPGDYGKTWPNKRFAVPFESVGAKIVPPHAEGQYILNVNQEFLERSPGFDIDNWPDFADPRFNSVLKDYYKEVKLDMVA